MHLFDRDLQLEPAGPMNFKGEISKNWLINGIANGGYVMALLTNAMQQFSAKTHTPIITATYIYRCLPGPVEIRVEEIASSNGFSRYQAGLFQEEKEKVRAWGTFLLPNSPTAPDRCETGPPHVAPLQECIAIPALPIHTLMNNIEMRLDPASAGWLFGNLTERSEQKGWIAFREARPYDNLSLLLVADAFPPPYFVSHGLNAWVPTVELSVNIRNIPQSNWLKFSLSSRFLTHGLVEEDGEVWDEAGNLVAISRQIAQVRANG